MSRRLFWPAVAGLVLLTGAGAVAGAAAAGGSSSASEIDVRTVELDVRYSRFSTDNLAVPAGTTVRFVVRNGDPIPHELIVGDQAVHDRHESGTEAHHDAVPGEVSVAAGSTAETTFTLDEPGLVLFACHLPGHFAYGMKGTITVV